MSEIINILTQWILRLGIKEKPSDFRDTWEWTNIYIYIYHLRCSLPGTESHNPEPAPLRFGPARAKHVMSGTSLRKSQVPTFLSVLSKELAYL